MPTLFIDACEESLLKFLDVSWNALSKIELLLFDFALMTQCVRKVVVSLCSSVLLPKCYHDKPYPHIFINLPLFSFLWGHVQRV